MNNLQPIENNNQRVLTTAQIAEQYETDTQVITNNFNRNKKRYVEGKHYFALEGEEKRTFLNLTQIDLGSAKNSKTLYLWTEKGALLHAKSLNTDKAWQAYEVLVDTYFNVNQQVLLPQQQADTLAIQRMEAEARQNRAIAMRINAENRRMKLLLEHPNMDQISPIALETMGLKRLEQVTGVDVGNALPKTEQTYSATEVGKMLGGISANKIGTTANRNGLKTDEYGIKVMDKSRYSTKEVPSFRYNMAGVKKLAEILGVEVSV